jgi:hypothetical protein
MEHVDRDPRGPHWERMRYAITCELDAQLWLRSDRIRREDLDSVSEAIVDRLVHAFRVEWAPEWDEEPAEDDETLGLDAATFHGGALTGEGERFPIFDHGWPDADRARR